MKVNGTLTTKSGSWNQIKKHVSRNWQHDKNEKSVDKTLSKYNLHDDFLSTEKYKNRLLKAHYSSFLARRNEKVRKQGHLNRQQSLDEYLKNRTPTALGIATFGDQNDKSNVMLAIDDYYHDRSRSENHRRYYQCASWGLKRYVHGFNQRNRYVKVTHWWTNVDEQGAPHVHFELLPLGYTKLNKSGCSVQSHRAPYKSGKRKGQMHYVSGSKPSGNLTNAVEMEMGTNNNRLAFKKWNDRETKAIVGVVGHTFHQRFSKVPTDSYGDFDFDSFTFHRQHTGRKGSISMKSYKATWDKIDKQDRELDNKRDSIQKAEDDFSPLADSYHYYYSAVPKLKRENNDLKDQLKLKQGRIKQLNNQRSNLEQVIKRLRDDKNNLKHWLKVKWLAYRKKHLNGYYHGLSLGIKYLYPDIQKSIEAFNKKHSYHQSFMDFATGRYTWGSKESGHVGGMRLFLRGLKRKGKGFFKHYTTMSLSKSFTNKVKNRSKSRSPQRDNGREPGD